MSRNRILLVTAGIMLSLFLAAMESTVVATAMPTIVGQLGGLEHYSWVFSAYMLASTTTVPLYGKISDLFGRRRLYLIAMVLFLAGSVLSGLSRSMPELIAARTLQGLGAGGILPLAFILIGEIFSLSERARMQGFFSGVWGVSSIVGPLLGGFLVDQLSWRWVFFINLVPGIVAAALVAFAWRDQPHAHGKPSVDVAGAFLLTASVVALLLGLVEIGTPTSWVLIGASVLLFLALLWAENRAPDPILPIHLFRDRLFSAAVAHGVLTGWAMFGSVSFFPLFVQSVLGTNATQAGITITPMLLGWVVASIIGMRLLVKVGYRLLGLVGTALLALGAFLLTLIGAHSSQALMMVFVALMGIGMGLSIPAFLVAIQTGVERRYLGAATSMLQFSRSMGGTLGVSVMGAALSLRLIAAGLDAGQVTSLLDPVASLNAQISQEAAAAMANAMHSIFVIAFVAAFLGLAAAFFAPHRELEEKTQTVESEPPLVSVD
ncbi:MAG TPA: MDR family MFS transporter [Anaerolineales bacterium]